MVLGRPTIRTCEGLVRLHTDGGSTIVRNGRGTQPVSGAVDARLGLDKRLLRRRGVRGRRFRLRNGLSTFALVVIIAGPARVRLFAAGTKFSAHRRSPMVSECTQRMARCCSASTHGDVTRVTSSCDAQGRVSAAWSTEGKPMWWPKKVEVICGLARGTGLAGGWSGAGVRPNATCEAPNS
jgi:hypothetical protein